MPTPLNLIFKASSSLLKPALIFESKDPDTGHYIEEKLTFQELARELEQVAVAKETSSNQLLALEALPSRERILRVLWRLNRGLPTLLLHPSLGINAQHELIVRAQSSTLHPEALVVLATSGSSGQAKLVQLGAAQLKAAARASQQLHPFSSQDRWLFSLPYAHVGGLCILIRCLLNQSCVVFPENKQPESICRLKITIASLVPTQLRSWLSSEVDFKQTALRYQLIGGAPVQTELLKKARERGLNPLRTYGLTETCAQIATESTFLSGVKPLGGIELRENNGEIQVRAAQLMLGYLHEAPLNRREFFSTGDLGTFSGTLNITGRKDARFISGGENISPEWVENQVGKINGVKDWALTWQQDERWGQAAVFLYVTLPQSLIKQEQITDAFRCVPPYARPKKVVQVSSLPLTRTGKLARAQLPELVAQGKPI